MQNLPFLSIFRNAVHAYNMLCQPILEEYELPQMSFDILMFLANHPEHCTAQEISEMRMIKKNLVSVHVKKLVDAGYLRRGSVEGDRRKVALSCTEKAAPIIRAGAAMQEDYYARLAQNICLDHWDIYKETVEIMSENIDRIIREV